MQGLGFDLDLWRRLLSTATLVPTEGFSLALCSEAFPGWWVFLWEPRWWGWSFPEPYVWFLGEVLLEVALRLFQGVGQEQIYSLLC